MWLSWGQPGHGDVPKLSGWPQCVARAEGESGGHKVAWYPLPLPRLLEQRTDRWSSLSPSRPPRCFLQPGRSLSSNLAESDLAMAQTIPSTWTSWEGERVPLTRSRARVFTQLICHTRLVLEDKVSHFSSITGCRVCSSLHRGQLGGTECRDIMHCIFSKWGRRWGKHQDKEIGINIQSVMLPWPLRMEGGANTHWEWLRRVLCTHYLIRSTLSLLDILHQKLIWWYSCWGSAGSFTLTKARQEVTEPCLKMSFPPKPTCTLSTMQHCLLSWKLIIISGSNSKSFLCARIKSKALPASVLLELYLDLFIPRLLFSC